MSEKRFTIKSTATELELYDNGVKIGEFPHYEWVARPVDYVVKTLNEQQATIIHLEKVNGKNFAKRRLLEQDNLVLRNENEQLRQMIKENVFQQYNEGSLADLKFKAIAYDDIIKVKLSDESEPKVIVICKQGKKGNVISFCQMFIPFGVYYEIKEGDDEIGRV